MDVLLLGGTGEALALAQRLDADGVAVTTALAGRTAKPLRPRGALRIGGFGGADGLAAFLAAERPRALVDATHPFAAQMSINAVAAAAATQTPLCRLARPGWREQAGDRWERVPDLAAAATATPAGARVLLTLGSRGFAAFSEHATAWFLLRAIDPPDAALPPRSELLYDRGPFAVASERALMREHAIDLLVTRDSGGEQTRAKLTAARELGIAVLMIDRPPLPPAPHTAATAAEAHAWVRSSACPPPLDSSPGAAGSRPASASRSRS